MSEIKYEEFGERPSVGGRSGAWAALKSSPDGGVSVTQLQPS